MVEIGDEFIIESYKIPWLIWIQLLVTILLILLLFFGFNSDPSSAAAAASPSNGRNAALPIHPNRIIKVENQRAGRDAGISGGGSMGEDGRSGEGSSMKNSSIFQHPNHHLCNYIGLAKHAIFKCFGLDSSSERSSNNNQHENQE